MLKSKGVHMIIGTNSQTGKVQYEDNIANKKQTIGTSRNEDYYFLDGMYSKGEEGLQLADGEVINDGVKAIIEECNPDFLRQVDITMHAMSKDKEFNSNYPRDILDSLSNEAVASAERIKQETSECREGLPEELSVCKEDFSQKVTAVLISYNHEGINTYYPAAFKKKEIEESFLSCSADQKKIVDLEIFDSPLGVMGNFINFLESSENNPLFENIQKQIQDFLGEDYYSLIELFKKYPLKGKLSKDQISMKELEEKGELDTLINQVASVIDLAKLSYISGIISELYLELAMTILNHNREEILDNSTSDRLNIGWEIIGGIIKYNFAFSGSFSKEDLIYAESLDQLLKYYSEKLEKKLDRNIDETKVSNLVYLEDGYNYKVTTLKDGKIQIVNTIDYVFNIKYLDTINDHFGIIPLFMQHNLIKKSGIMKGGESIKSIKTSSMIYIGADIRLIREGNTVKIVNRDNETEIFSELQIFDGYYPVKEASNNGFILEIEENNNFDETQLMHREEWYKEFNNSIPESIGEIPVLDSSSAIIEYIGFKLYDGLLKNQKNSERVKNMFKRAKKCDFSSLKGMFGKVDTTYISPIFKELVEKDRSPSIRITNLSYMRGPIAADVETIDKDGNLLCAHKIIIA